MTKLKYFLIGLVYVIALAAILAVPVMEDYKIVAQKAVYANK